MPITFYYLSGSPFAWKVWLALEHKQLAYDPRVLSADAGDLKTLEFTAINPRGKVPVIIDDGFILYESGPIIEYLEEKYPRSGESLWPGGVRDRALARRVAGEADGYLYPQVRKLVLELIARREGEPDMEVVAGAKTALTDELSHLGKSISCSFVSGSRPSAADFALYPLTALLGRIHSRRPEHGVTDAIPERLRQWMARVEMLPYFAKTTPPHWSSL